MNVVESAHGRYLCVVGAGGSESSVAVTQQPRRVWWRAGSSAIKSRVLRTTLGNSASSMSVCLPACLLLCCQRSLPAYNPLLPNAGLIEASASTGAGSYGGLVRRTLGPKAEATLQFAVFANCYIMEVVFVVVLGDILIGTAPEYGGLLPEWTGVPDPAACWWLRRDVVLGAVSVLVLLPLAAMRSMERLAVVNIIGACWLLFAGCG